MHIAICDNERIVAEQLSDQIRQFEADSNISVFTDIVRFFGTIEDSAFYDLVFMDIDWGQSKNGMNYAEKILYSSPGTQVIYITGYGAEYSQQIFLSKSNLCGFLTKPVESRYLSELLLKIRENIHVSAEYKLVIQNKGVTETIPYSEIFYFENKGHKTVIYLRNRSIVFNEPLEKMRKKLPQFFLNCHKSFCINMDYIRRIDKSGILLENEIKVPVSKTHYAETRENYFRYVGEKI